MGTREEEKHLPDAQEPVTVPITRLGIEKYLCGGHGPLPTEEGELVEVPTMEIVRLGIEAMAEEEHKHLFDMLDSTMNDEGLLEDFRNNPLPLLPFPHDLFHEEMCEFLDDEESPSNSIAIEIEVDDSDNTGLLREPINETDLLEAIRRNPSNKPELVPDAIHLSEPITDLGLYMISVEKDGKSYEQKLWVLPTVNNSS